MKGMPGLALAVVAIAVTASACTPSKASESRPSVEQVAQMDLHGQKQMPPLETAARFCVAGIFRASKKAAIGLALERQDPSGGEAAAWEFTGLEGDQVTVKKELTSGQIFTGTFDLGQLIYGILGGTGEEVGNLTNDKALAFQWKLFSLIGPAAIYCTEAALWLGATVTGQLGAAILKRFPAFSVSEQLLASRGSAITGKWVLYRKLANCSILSFNNNKNHCERNPMDVTIACSGTACTIIRTNGAAGFPPWDRSIPLAFGQGAWRATGTERWAAQCNHAAVPGTGVALVLTVTSGQVANGVWRAGGLKGTYSIENVATTCWPAGAGVGADLSTTPFAA